MSKVETNGDRAPYPNIGIPEPKTVKLPKPRHLLDLERPDLPPERRVELEHDLMDYEGNADHSLTIIKEYVPPTPSAGPKANLGVVTKIEGGWLGRN